VSVEVKTLGEMARSDIALADTHKSLLGAERLLRMARSRLDLKDKDGAIQYMDEALERMAWSATSLAGVDFS
jgi:hypothetical protein